MKKYCESGHRWKQDSFGDIDWFAFSSDLHNGPECEVCERSFCVHCTPDPGLCPGPNNHDSNETGVMNFLSGADTLDQVLLKCFKFDICRVEQCNLSQEQDECFEHRSGSALIHYGLFWFDVSPAPVGNDVDVWIYKKGMGARNIISVTYLHDCMYKCGNNKWERGAWDRELESAIGYFKTEILREEAKELRAKIQREAEEHEAAQKEREKWEALFR